MIIQIFVGKTEMKASSFEGEKSPEMYCKIGKHAKNLENRHIEGFALCEKFNSDAILKTLENFMFIQSFLCLSKTT